MGVWAFSEQTLAEHSCGASLWLDRAPGLPAPPATFPVQLSPSSNITFPSKITARMAGGLEGFCQSSCTRALLRGSRQFSLVCCLREREGEREEQRRAGREGESARGGERAGERRGALLIETGGDRNTCENSHYPQQLRNSLSTEAATQTIKTQGSKSAITRPHARFVQTKLTEPRFWRCVRLCE